MENVTLTLPKKTLVDLIRQLPQDEIEKLISEVKSTMKIAAETVNLRDDDKLALISKLISSMQGNTIKRKRSLLELERLGKEIWQGIDANSYIDELRSEWDDTSKNNG